MLINLFKDDSICEKTGKIKAPLVRRDFILSTDIENYKNCTSDDPYVQWHAKEVLSKCNKNKSYTNKMIDIKMDTHIELEKAGLGKDDRPYRTIVSLEDSLDYILASVCKGDWRNIYKMPNYRDISRALLNLNLDAIGDLNFENLIGLDEELNKYFLNLCKYNDNVKRIIYFFYRDILLKGQDIACYIAVYLKYYYQEQGVKLVVKSMSGSSVVLTSPIDIDIKVELPDDYSIFVKSFKPNEYLYSSNFEYRGGNS